LDASKFRWTVPNTFSSGKRMSVVQEAKQFETTLIAAFASVKNWA
jgi:hypothetical protein